MEKSFNSEQRLKELFHMQPHQKLAFGAACCERMLHNYEAFMLEVASGDIDPLRRALDAVWDACQDVHLQESGLRDMLSQCEESAPDSDDFISLYTSPAQDVTFAICALLDFLLDGDLGRIVSVPRLATDSIDLIIQELGEMNPSDPFREQEILEHPLMQQELVRQQRDILETKSLLQGDKTALAAFRAQSRRESNLTLAP